VPRRDPISFDVLAAGETDRGVTRTTNEDAFLVRSELGLYIVADGAGGHNAGNVASAIATSTIARQFDDSEAEYAARPEVDAFGLHSQARRLSIAVQAANRAVIEIARTSNQYRGMGTTVVCALLAPDTAHLHVASVGDSRCYRLRQGTLELLTHDHSILNDVLELYPELDDPALSTLPRKAITRALGMEERVRVSLRTVVVSPLDRFLLCSDGLTGELAEPDIEDLLGRKSPPADIVRDLVRAAKDAGGRDNVTALVLDCRTSTSAPRPRPPKAPPPEPSPKPPAQSDGSQPAIDVSEVRPSDPEIVVIRRAASASPTESSEPEIRVVPVNSADAQTIRALDRVAETLGPVEVSCPQCGARKERAALVCPRCGRTRAEASE
jgi:PPM family protein phosphatase